MFKTSCEFVRTKRLHSSTEAMPHPKRPLITTVYAGSSPSRIGQEERKESFADFRSIYGWISCKCVYGNVLFHFMHCVHFRCDQ